MGLENKIRIAFEVRDHGEKKDYYVSVLKFGQFL